MNKNIYVVTQDDGEYTQIICAFTSKKKALKYCSKNDESYAFQSVKLKGKK